MSQGYLMEIVTEVVRVLIKVSSRIIAFPSTMKEWRRVERGFASRHNYPAVVGAIDGSLLHIQRPRDFEGFYCRKGYPALNLQAIVTSDKRFLSTELRPGSWSDRKAWKYSAIGRHVHDVIPPGTHFIGDAGYALSPALMVPYMEREEGGEAFVDAKAI
jgi:hypothetical protein